MAATNANDATTQALNSAETANIARDQCLAAIENLHWEIRELDGGDAHIEENEYKNEYDGGGA